jgi:hypothetical protein
VDEQPLRALELRPLSIAGQNRAWKFRMSYADEVEILARPLDPVRQRQVAARAAPGLSIRSVELMYPMGASSQT